MARKALSILCAFGVLMALGGFAPPAVAKEPALPHPLLWLVQGTDAKVYLFGSIHVMKEGVNWLTPSLRAKFESADSVWLETADIENKQLLLQSFSKYAANPAHNMTAGLSDEEIKALTALLAHYHLSLQKFMGLKKWAVGIMLMNLEVKEMGFEAENGVDKTFLKRAQYLHKKVYGFESLETEARAIAAVNDAEDLAALRDMLSSSKTDKALFPAMFDAWCRGDEKALNALVNGTMKMQDKTMYEKLILQRNIAWEPQIESLIDFGKGTSFVVVGAGHLVGLDGLPAMLRAQGYDVRQVKY